MLFDDRLKQSDCQRSLKVKQACQGYFGSFKQSFQPRQRLERTHFSAILDVFHHFQIKQNEVAQFAICKCHDLIIFLISTLEDKRLTQSIHRLNYRNSLLRSLLVQQKSEQYDNLYFKLKFQMMLNLRELFCIQMNRVEILYSCFLNFQAFLTM